MESLIIAAQDQALNMHYHQRNIMKQLNNSKCKMWYKAEEHIKHIVAGCTTLAPSEYTNRHNRVAGNSHWTMCKHMGLQVTDKYYEHTPEREITVNGTTIMWDVPVFTNPTLPANQPDIIQHDIKQLLSYWYSHTRWLKHKQIMEKISIYKDLKIKVSRMW
jgi:hypothetical protein